MVESKKPVCPVHLSEMKETMQWDLQKVIYYCPESGCKHRYIEGFGPTTTDQMISSREPS